MYLATQVMSEKDKEKLLRIFITIDTNGDGKLSKEELINGFKSFGEPEAKAIAKVNEILKNLDIDKNGSIGYSEFLMALMNKKQMLSKKNLIQAFNAFDKNKDGYIVASEIKDLLNIGHDYSEETWLEIVSEIDKNKDGKISFKEFESMMKKFLN
jgi:calcium-dependent protein kinase